MSLPARQTSIRSLEAVHRTNVAHEWTTVQSLSCQIQDVR